ncbi:MAG: 2-phospho-L-lactate transferase CofD family protein, partial [Dehalococcoidia bacterium]
ERYGSATWFNLGDKDLATHIERTRLLSQGCSLTEVTGQLSRALGVQAGLVPMSDQPVRTIVETGEGDLPFQEYFVMRQCEPRVTGVRFEGAHEARMSPAFKQALRKAQAVIFCPSNPMVSIGPILSVPDVREEMASFQGPRVAVSPIVGDQALRGPAAKMFSELGEDVSCVGVARRLLGVCDILVIDRQDAHRAGDIREAGLEPVVLDTIMETDADKERLAREVLQVVQERLRG